MPKFLMLKIRDTFLMALYERHTKTDMVVAGCFLLLFAVLEWSLPFTFGYLDPSATNQNITFISMGIGLSDKLGILLLFYCIFALIQSFVDKNFGKYT